MPGTDPPVPPFLRTILDAVLSELRAVAARCPQDDRLKVAVSHVEAAVRSLANPAQV